MLHVTEFHEHSLRTSQLPNTQYNKICDHSDETYLSLFSRLPKNDSTNPYMKKKDYLKVKISQWIFNAKVD